VLELMEGQLLSDSDLPQCWQHNAHFVQVLAMQQELLKPQWILEGNLQMTISKPGGFLASSIECDSAVSAAPAAVGWQQVCNIFHKLTMPMNTCKQTNVRLLTLQMHLMA